LTLAHDGATVLVEMFLQRELKMIFIEKLTHQLDNAREISARFSKKSKSEDVLKQIIFQGKDDILDYYNGKLSIEDLRKNQPPDEIIQYYYGKDNHVSEIEFIPLLREAESILFERCPSIYRVIYFMLEKNYVYGWMERDDDEEEEDEDGKVVISPEERKMRMLGKCKTASVSISSYEKKKYKVSLNINVNFFVRNCVNSQQRAGLLEHELLHIILGHLKQFLQINNKSKKKHTHKIINIAQDLSINSIIASYSRGNGHIPHNYHDTQDKIENKHLFTIDLTNLPSNIGVHKTKVFKVFKKNGDELIVPKSQRKNNDEFYSYGWYLCVPGIGTFKNILPGLSSEEYLDIIGKDKLIQRMIQYGYGLGGDGGDGDHISIDDLDSDELEELKKQMNEMDGIVRNAILDANASGKGLSSNKNLNQALSKLMLPNPNYDEILRNFIAECVAEKEDSWVRENRRGVDGMPGNVYEPEHDVAIFVDQSGSMSDEDIERCFGRITNLLDRANCTVYNFANEIDFENAYEASSASELRYERTLSGGTAFEPILEYLKGNSKYSAGFIISDMGNNRGVPQKTIDNVVFVCDKAMSCLDDTEPYERAGWHVCKM
jgi:predicted metal-dependent peptidase